MTVNGQFPGVLRRPVPELEPYSAGFWAPAPARRINLQTCSACGAVQHPPLPVCAACGSGQLGFVDHSGDGTAYSFVVCERTFNAAFEAEGRYVLASIALDEVPDVRIFSNIVGCDPDSVRIGARVRVRHDPLDSPDGPLSVPVFEPAEDA
ncbi:OB-fold domain-containing protein [Amycolatopsis rhabdoformis]|uniref:OB-fold domain-containing protein n=1 Tax=Amycolatopsis rhabdoformis TaxID=1448059 RepID=A0ABZ1IGA0_9PSEU|nr:OB-fold domain-containing protein [Amycolatopsis rhabdoformis]WSE32584.1 OB-fold domain-containing protein [Amycolatopsis rhabdoformis]